ncbi:hypothetical protein MmiHf6_02140 [Methanimicrococcus hongohii]|uniref:DUF4261 domain-containing protein n=1 Tax=Methanimicrococcus hongohii TaxID=3028295 RepID=A0AA96V9G0_9EURY|nr:DUF4261 domain-containing protein [Methanimicrococcus sp. Hf6]WNY22922.1 hypothetical protein MmiHf6_02140 [Methanimicrococcus sp. Hf6]
MDSRDEILEQIAARHENDEHQEIIDAISEIPESERDYELICLLARAYNNIEDHEKALELLLSVKEEGQYDILWHFRIGYAYYYMDMLESAEKAFERVLESDPENRDAIDFLEWTRDEIEEAAEIKPMQEENALDQMIHWLSHENELGAAPAEIEKVGEFDLHGKHYYIYKYKKTKEEPWLIGVCGGYGRRDLDHCGHVFSEMEEYYPDTAEEKAIVLVEMLRKAWMEEAEKEMKENGIIPGSKKNEPRKGPFAGFVLLNSYTFNPEQIKSVLKNDWDIIVREIPKDPDAADETSFIFEIDGMTAAVNLIEDSVPNKEAEHFAEMNYMWPEAAAVTKTHVAQILIAVIENDQPAIDAGILFTKIAASCLKLENAIGIYTAGTVFQPEFYIDVAGLIDGGDLPILNWVYFGVYTNERGTSGYTYGLRTFGKEEIEVINSTAMPETIHDFLIDIVYYILSNDVTLEDGETIGFTEFQKLKITKSKGIALDGYTLKIEY